MQRALETGDRRRLGEVLVGHGSLSPSDLHDLLEQEERGGNGNRMRLGSRCLERGLLQERPIARALAEQLGHPAVVLSESVLDLTALELVPRVIAAQHQLLPLAIDDERLTVATIDADERDIFTHISFASGRRVEALLALEGALARTIASAYAALSRRERSFAGAAAGSETSPRLEVERPGSEADAADPIRDLVELSDVVSEEQPFVSPAASPLVLVVDDEDDLRSLLERILLHDGYRVALARTGREAMELLRKERPSVVLLDAMLPEVHGFEICRAIKQSEALRSLPVVMISAVYQGWENARDIQEVHGADAFVEKPFDVHYLRELVARMLGKTAPRPTVESDRRQQIERARTRAQVSYKMGDLDDAMLAIESWRDLDPFDAEAYLLLGNVHTRRRDSAGAMRAYERAATFGPALFAAFKNLALTYEQLGFTTRAYASWYRASELADDPALRDQIQHRLRDRYPARG